MFVDVTRYGGLRVLRVAVAAIAYLDEVQGGCAVHLVGGETLRVNEDPAEIEARCAPPTPPPPAMIDTIDPTLEARATDALEAAGLISAVEATERRIEQIVEQRDVDASPSKRASRGRHGR